MNPDHCPVFALLGKRGDPERHCFDSLDMSKELFAKEKSSECVFGANLLNTAVLSSADGGMVVE